MSLRGVTSKQSVPLPPIIELKLMSRNQNMERGSVVVEKIASSYLLAMTLSVLQESLERLNYALFFQFFYNIHLRFDKMRPLGRDTRKIIGWIKTVLGVTFSVQFKTLTRQ